MMSPITVLLDTLFPTSCACCGKVLVRGEKQVCVSCLSSLELTEYSSIDDNYTEKLLAGRIPYVHATSLCYYRKAGQGRNMVHAMKFHGNTELCRIMGRQMGLDLMQSGRFDKVDMLVPVPLHWWRRTTRGYNQSDMLCRGMAEVMNIPVNTTALVRHVYTMKQSQQSGDNRLHNVADAFRVRRPEELAGRHIVLVDDVLTTGATMMACCDALAAVPNLQISIATFAVAAK